MLNFLLKRINRQNSCLTGTKRAQTGTVPAKPGHLEPLQYWTDTLEDHALQFFAKFTPKWCFSITRSICGNFVFIFCIFAGYHHSCAITVVYFLVASLITLFVVGIIDASLLGDTSLLGTLRCWGHFVAGDTSLLGTLRCWGHFVAGDTSL